MPLCIVFVKSFIIRGLWGESYIYALIKGPVVPMRSYDLKYVLTQLCKTSDNFAWVKTDKNVHNYKITKNLKGYLRDYQNVFLMKFCKFS